MAIEDIQYIGIVLYLVSVIVPTTVGPEEKNFKIKVLRRLENGFFQIQYFVGEPFH